jgi:hypothetical protein
MGKNMQRAPTSAQRLLKKKDVAEQKNVCVRTVDYWLTRGWLPYIKIGRAVRIAQADSDEFDQARKIVGKNKMKCA